MLPSGVTNKRPFTTFMLRFCGAHTRNKCGKGEELGIKEEGETRFIASTWPVKSSDKCLNVCNSLFMLHTQWKEEERERERGRVCVCFCIFACSEYV